MKRFLLAMLLPIVCFAEPTVTAKYVSGCGVRPSKLPTCKMKIVRTQPANTAIRSTLFGRNDGPSGEELPVTFAQLKAQFISQACADSADYLYVPSDIDLNAAYTGYHAITVHTVKKVKRDKDGNIKCD